MSRAKPSRQKPARARTEAAPSIRAAIEHRLSHATLHPETPGREEVVTELAQSASWLAFPGMRVESGRVVDVAVGDGLNLWATLTVFENKRPLRIDVTAAGVKFARPAGNSQNCYELTATAPDKLRDFALLLLDLSFRAAEMSVVNIEES